MSNRAANLAVCMIVVLGDMTSSCGHEDRELTFVRDAHKASRETIQRCICTVEFAGLVTNLQTGATKEEACRGRFWYGHDSVRGQIHEFGKEVDYLWKDSERWALVKMGEGGRSVGASRDQFPSRHLGRCDAWVRGLLILNEPGTVRSLPFEQLLSKASKVSVTSHTGSADGECIHVTLRFTGWTVDVWFDKRTNYLVRKVIYLATSDGGRFQREEEVIKFVECDPGVYFPERLAGKSGPPGAPDFTHTTVLSHINVNKPIPATVFKLPYQHGMILTDNIRSTRYEVDTAGNRISREVPFTQAVPPPGLSETDPASRQSETAGTEWSWRALLMPAGLTVLAVSLSLVVWRRLRCQGA